VTTVIHQVTLASDEHFGGKLPPHFLGMFLAELPSVIRGAVAMALSNRSVPKGKGPAWLDRAADIRFVDHQGNGNTTLFFEAPQLGQAAHECYHPGERWGSRPDPDSTGFDLLGKVLHEVESQNTDSDHFDTPLLKRLVRFQKVFQGPFREAAFQSQQPGDSSRLNLDVVNTAAKLCSDTPLPKRIRLVGALAHVDPSNQTLGLRLNDCQEVQGALLEGQAHDLASLLNQQVLVFGKAVYRASGRVLRLDIDGFRTATPQDSFFSQLPAPTGTKIKADGLFQGQPRKKGIQALFGKWPGDETDEQIEAAFRELG